jgi:hypothetical protein
MLCLHVSEVIPDDIKLRVDLRVDLLHFLEGLLVEGHLRLLVELPHIVLDAFQPVEFRVEVLGPLLAFEELIGYEGPDFLHFVSVQQLIGLLGA